MTLTSTNHTLALHWCAHRLVGDVDFDEAVGVAGAITPVPGGVGPMTITMLLKNTVDSGRRFFDGTVQQQEEGRQANKR